MFEKVLSMTKPALVLIDELADYCVAASGVAVGASTLSDQTISFIQELSEAVTSIDNCVLVATLPASESEVANSQQASQIFKSLSDRLDRIGADTKPVTDDEIFEVIRSRLFEDLGDEKCIDEAVSKYFKMYQSHHTELPQKAVTTEYKNILKKSYPFHPELIDIFRIKWASNHSFQRTRGVLRLLASIVADLWNRQSSLTGTNYFIHPSDICLENIDSLTGQLKKLYGNGYDAVITADVSGHSSNAFKIDSEKKEYGKYNLCQGIAVSILLGSFGSSGVNKGTDIKELKLSVLKPDTFNHNSVNGALDVFESFAHYLYYSSAGSDTKRYWFHTKPNINILINQAKNDVKKSEIDAEILQRINKSLNAINLFNTLVDPSKDIPEQKKPTLIVLHPQFMVSIDNISKRTKQIIEDIATKKGGSERIYRNTILFLVPTEKGMGKLYDDLKDYISCIKIRDEYQSQLEKEQKEDINRKIDDYNQTVQCSLVAAYSTIIKYSAKDGCSILNIKQFKDTLENQINYNIIQKLKDEEWLLEGIGTNELNKNNLLPTIEKNIKAKDVYEAFLRYDDKPMITGQTAVQSSLLRHCMNGVFAIAAGDGNNFDNVYYKESVPYFDVNDASYWLVDKSLYKPEPEPFPEPTTPTEPVPCHGAVPNTQPSQPKCFKSITISGKVDIPNYNQIFSSFVMPLTNNNVEIEFKITGKSKESNPITETSEQYRITKESAKQLGLKFEEE